MPLPAERDFTALAMSQNMAAWSKQDDPEFGEHASRLIPDFEASAHRQQAAYLSARRARLVSHINETIDLPKLFWRHRYFRDLPGAVVLSTDEAVTEIRREIAREQRRRGHWSHKPGRIPNLKEALVFARFFRRFGKRVWLGVENERAA